jgi:hypothetical protein
MLQLGVLAECAVRLRRQVFQPVRQIALVIRVYSRQL